MRPHTISTVEPVLRDTGLRRMGGTSAVLYSDVSGHCSYCQGQKPPLHAGGVLPLQLLGKCPALLLKWAKQVNCQEHQQAAGCGGAEPTCSASGRGAGESSLLESTEGQRIYRSFSRHHGQALRQPFSPPSERSREGVEEGNADTGMHGEHWQNASGGDTLHVVMRTQVQSADLVTCARGFKGSLLP